MGRRVEIWDYWRTNEEFLPSTKGRRVPKKLAHQSRTDASFDRSLSSELPLSQNQKSAIITLQLWKRRNNKPLPFRLQHFLRTKDIPDWSMQQSINCFPTSIGCHTKRQKPMEGTEVVHPRIKKTCSPWNRPTPIVPSNNLFLNFT